MICCNNAFVGPSCQGYKCYRNREMDRVKNLRGGVDLINDSLGD